MIDFVSAKDGVLEMYAGKRLVAEVCTAKSVAYYLHEEGYDGHYSFSSSMDFASEYGFDSDGDAHDIFERGVALYRMDLSELPDAYVEPIDE